ncbi:MAG: hypothetical protein C4323_26270 [Mastigocladus sp. ERB_26_2]
MRKSKLKLIFILSAIAITTSVILSSEAVCAVDQRESTNSTVNSEQQHCSESTKVAIAGIGIVLITGLLVSGFLYQKRRTRRMRAVKKQLDGLLHTPLLADPATANSEETVVTPTPESVSNSSDSEQTPITDHPLAEPTTAERYQNLIAEIVATALKGQIRSKEYIYRQLVENVSSGTGEIFERCLSDRLNTTQSKLDNTANSPSFFERETPELKKARLSCTLKALQSIQAEWERLQKQKRTQAAVTAAAEQILAASTVSRFSVLLEIIDPNQNQVFSHSQLQQLAQELTQAADTSDDLSTKEEIQQLASGITRGITSYQQLEGSLVRWIYEPAQLPLGLNRSLHQG